MQSSSYWEPRPSGHTLTGVWVEIIQSMLDGMKSSCHTLTGVWVEISTTSLAFCTFMSHPHGCVSWNINRKKSSLCYSVTPSRVCELKFPCHFIILLVIRHTLTGVWVEIIADWRIPRIVFCHTLTGVWVEIGLYVHRLYSISVTPSRVCELKSKISVMQSAIPNVTPSRVCELKL